MKKEIQINKDRCNEELNNLFLLRIYEIWESYSCPEKTPISYSAINKKICRTFSLKKEYIMGYLRFFENLGYIKIAKRGVFLNYQII